MTPFGQVIVDYMWNKRPANRPPLSANQLAIRLGVPKQNTNNWIFRASLPPFETIMAVLAKLDIPLRDLYDAYKKAGILMPRWDEQDTDSPVTRDNLPPTPRTRKATAISTSIASNDSGDDAPAPRPYTPPPAYNPADEESANWQRLAEQTEAAMREEGAPQAMIDAVVAHIRARQTGPDPIQHNLIAEHDESPATTSGTPAESDTPNRQTSSRRPQG
jgi:hypothetical protein